MANALARNCDQCRRSRFEGEGFTESHYELGFVLRQDTDAAFEIRIRAAAEGSEQRV